jgi:hypothetical protein
VLNLLVMPVAMMVMAAVLVVLVFRHFVSAPHKDQH